MLAALVSLVAALLLPVQAGTLADVGESLRRDSVYVDPEAERPLTQAEADQLSAAIIDGRQPPAPPEELRRPGRHHEPALAVDRYGQPVYAGGTTFYGGSWFGGGGGLFSGLLLGSMLGGWGPLGWGGGWSGGAGGGDGWGGGFGGGDWGGDIGGGDW